MSLSDDERQRLQEIETLTAAADPQFARRLDLADAQRRRRRLSRLCWWLLALSVWTMFSGVTEAHGVISIGTIVGCSGCALVIWSACAIRSLRTPHP